MKLGPYEIHSLVGSGGMGEVYRARDGRLQREVAIKILSASLARDEDRLRRFEQEARAVAALNHPNLLTVFDVGSLPPSDEKTAGSPFIVSELLEGTTLRQRLSDGLIGPRKVLEYAVQIANGLAAAHERGIIHRDIKPENIFITKDDRIKILDFGLAKLTQADFESHTSLPTVTSATELGLVMGTIGYMSPEQLRGKKVDARSDIFSFGAVLYEMLAQKKAFQGETGADVSSAILHQQPAELTQANQEISPALDHIVHHCLEKDPVLRFQSARDLAFQLNELRESRSSTTTRAVVEEQPPARSRRVIFATVGTIGLLLAIVATWIVARATLRTIPPKYSQLTYQQGYVFSARFLPDGKNFMCACRWGSDSIAYLYSGSVSDQVMRPLGVPVESLASVSAQGELLVIQNMRQIGPGYVRIGTLSRMPMSGGAPRPLLDDVQYADWAPGADDFLIVRFNAERHEYRLEYPKGKILYATGGWISDPRFSRDGKQIAFLDHPLFGDDAGSVAVIDLAGHKKTLSSDYASTQKLTWSPDGSEIWFSGVKNGVHRSLYATTVSGHERPLVFMPGHVDIEDALPAGQALLNVTADRRVIEVVTPEHPETRDFTWMDWAYGMRFSADGKLILFGDQHSGDNYGTFLRNLDGSPAVRLGDGDPIDVSADGKWALSRLPSTPSQLELLPTGTGEARQLTHSNINHISARWMPDGRIACNCNAPGHPERVYLIDTNGVETAVTPEGVTAVAITPDGKELLVRNSDTKRYEMFPLNGAPSRPLASLDKDDLPQDFTGDGKTLLVRRVASPTEIDISSLDIASGKRTLLHRVMLPGVPAVNNGLNAIVSRDGKSYAFQYHPSNSTVYLAEGLK